MSITSVARFADYFVISGLDIDSGLEPDQLSGDKFHCLPLNRPYKSKGLAHFPENVSWNPFDKDAVGMLCLPKGLTFRTQKQRQDPKFHTFIITREDGSRTFGAAYTFYEEVKNQQICAAMKTLHSMHLAELSNDQSRTLYSHLGSVYDPSTPKPQRKAQLQNPNDLYDIEKDTLYVTKCICVITQFPFVQACKKFLALLHKAILSRSDPLLPIESYIYNILYEVPLPPPGRSLQFSCMDKEIRCQRPGINELPLFDYPMTEMFILLGSENVLKIFTSVLLENQILLYSSDYQRLMLVAEGISALIFPFVWQHVYVPILPASLMHFLDAPVPFIMGLHHGYEERSDLQLPSEANMCFVDIDCGIVDVPEDLPQFPLVTELLEEIAMVLNKYGIVCKKNKSRESTLERRKCRSREGTLERKKSRSRESTLERKKSRSRESTLERKKSRSRESTLERKLKQGKGSYDNDSGMSSNDESASGPVIPNKMEILQQSEALAKIAAIARKTGVISSLEDLHDVINDNRKKKREKKIIEEVDSEDGHLKELKFSNAVRETFLNRFLHIFNSYEAFVIQPQSQDMESWLSNREMMQNFDRAAFLSDQPETYLPFMCCFVETQMFTTMVDNKILSQWEDPDPNLRVFEARLKTWREKYSDTTTPVNCDYDSYSETDAQIEKRHIHIDHIAPPPHELEGIQYALRRQGFFPDIQQTDILYKQPTPAKPKRDGAKWRRKDRQLQHSEHLQMKSEQREKYMQEARSKSVRQPKLSEMTQTGMAATNWKFVEALLKEAKAKTKRMLVEKMGQEAVDLGHGEVTLTGVEENALIASLCDLLERIWSHGLQTKQGKSALWSHLVSYHEIEECNDTGKPIDPNFLTPDISSLALEADSPTGTPPGTPTKRHRRKNSRGFELPTLISLPECVSFDIKNVKNMTAIKTDVGYARAWVRLALEKKLLSRHLKELLSDTDLLRSSYKRYAFLRCEDEREQFLYHLLSLNAVDYHCFTNNFPNTKVQYRVLIFPSRKFQGSTTSANPWVCLSGQLGDTGIVQITRNTLEVLIEHKNLGVLTTMRIGHDNAGMSPKWLIEHVLVRNEITGHTYKFPCGRWLGKGVDDGSSERLLVAERVAHSADSEELLSACSTPPRCRSPSMPRKNTVAEQIKSLYNEVATLANDVAKNYSPVYHHSVTNHETQLAEIQHMLGDAVNNIVKYFYKPEKERGSLTFLLCGDGGLVNCMEHVFQFGFRSSRLFRNRFYTWDYLEKNQSLFMTALRENSVQCQTKRAAYLSFSTVIARINESSQTVGKDGKFQLFICIGLRDHLLQNWFQLLSGTSVTAGMYEENSFLRDPSLLSYVTHLIHSLKDFDIILEASLVKGLDI